MKKIVALMLALAMVLSLAACGEKPEPTEPASTEKPTEKPTEAPTEASTEKPTEADIFAKSEGVMTFEQYAAAEDLADVTIEGFVQLCVYQAAYGNANLFIQDKDGGYFVYRMPMTDAEAAKIQVGTKLQVKGIKTAWAGEVEFKEGSAAATVMEGSYIAEAVDMTADFADAEALAAKMNMLVGFKGLTVQNVEAPASEGGDIYFDVAKDGVCYTFCIESDERNKDTDVYKTALALKAGDLIDLEGFLYWYNAPQVHTSKIEVKGNVFAKSEGIMTYEQYVAAEDLADVAIEGFVQLFVYQPAYGNAGVYLQDADGGYFAYRMPMTDADAAKIQIGTKLQVKGIKTAWAGEVELKEGSATAVVMDGCYIAKPTDASADFADADKLAAKMNMLVGFQGLTVEKVDAPASEGGDIYFDVTKDGTKYTFCVESDEWNQDTQVYKAVLGLQAGTVIDVQGILYWYNEPQLHTSAVSIVTPAAN